MDSNVRRDLVAGTALVVAGLGLLGFAWFGPDEGFQAPRWVVGLVALACVGAGFVMLRTAWHGERLVGATPRVALALAAVLLVIGAVLAWIVVAVGPEGTALTFGIPLAVSDDSHRGFVAALFYGLLGLGIVLCLG